jgi:alpha-tubulin suppressor-like RCC1 family protein
VGSDSDWSSISGGYYHTVALKTNGTLWAWGDNEYGQAGLGATVTQTTPLQVGSADTWSFISGGYFHTQAVKTDLTLWTWGHNNYGQLGLAHGNTPDITTPTLAGN